MTMTQFSALLKTVTPNVGHFESVKKQPPYIVYLETGGQQSRADDIVDGRTQQVQLGFFAKAENDPLLRDLTNLLDANEISYSEPTTTYERDTGLIHHIIDCEIEVD